MDIARVNVREGVNVQRGDGSREGSLPSPAVDAVGIGEISSNREREREKEGHRALYLVTLASCSLSLSLPDETAAATAESCSACFLACGHTGTMSQCCEQVLDSHNEGTEACASSPRRVQQRESATHLLLVLLLLLLLLLGLLLVLLGLLLGLLLLLALLLDVGELDVRVRRLLGLHVAELGRVAARGEEKRTRKTDETSVRALSKQGTESEIEGGESSLARTRPTSRRREGRADAPDRVGARGRLALTELLELALALGELGRRAVVARRGEREEDRAADDRRQPEAVLRARERTKKGSVRCSEPVVTAAEEARRAKGESRAGATKLSRRRGGARAGKAEARGREEKGRTVAYHLGTQPLVVAFWSMYHWAKKAPHWVTSAI